MAANDLNSRASARGKLVGWLGRFNLLGCALGGAGLLALFLIGWFVLVDDPLGGEPVVVMKLDRPAATQSDSGGDLGIRPTVDSRQADPLPSGHAQPPADIVISDPIASPQSRQDSVLSSLDQSLVENSRYGPLPVVSRDGRRAADVYSRASAATAAGPARIALLIGGMGLSRTATEAAIDRLPPNVTLAFAPYGEEIGPLAARARQAGHEIVLQVPLEPYDYPDNDPGPHTLLTGLSTDQNRDRLHWVMGRFIGYVGVLNYMGARFTSSDAALRPILGELRDRGLVYVDDGASPRSIASRIADEVGLPFAQADIVVDSVPSQAAIGDRLAELEAMAREKGLAIGIASGLPVTIEAIDAWADSLEAEGIVLVPVTAAVQGGEI